MEAEINMEYEALTKMGIQKPEEIVRYELYSVDQMDIFGSYMIGKRLPVTRNQKVSLSHSSRNPLWWTVGPGRHKSCLKAPQNCEML